MCLASTSQELRRLQRLSQGPKLLMPNKMKPNAATQRHSKTAVLATCAGAAGPVEHHLSLTATSRHGSWQPSHMTDTTGAAELLATASKQHRFTLPMGLQHAQPRHSRALGPHFTAALMRGVA